MPYKCWWTFSVSFTVICWGNSWAGDSSVVTSISYSPGNMHGADPCPLHVCNSCVAWAASDSVPCLWDPFLLVGWLVDNHERLPLFWRERKTDSKGRRRDKHRRGGGRKNCSWNVQYCRDLGVQTTLNCFELMIGLMEKGQQPDCLREKGVHLGSQDSEHNSHLVVAGILGACHAIEHNKQDC